MKADYIEPSSTLLTFYPCDILNRIVFNVGFTNLIPLLCQNGQLFLQLHPNLKQAICTLIKQKSVIKFRNLDTDSRDPVFHPQRYEYDPDPDIIDMADFKSAEEFMIVDNFCIDEMIELESHVVFQIYSITEFFDFTEFLVNIRPSETVKLRLYVNVGLAVVNYLIHHIDRNREYNFIYHLRNRLIAISSNLAQVFGSFSALHLDQFKDVEGFGFMDRDICGSFSSFKRLKTLQLVGIKHRWDNRLYLVDIRNFPMTLKTLQLIGCEHIYIIPVDEADAQSMQIPVLDDISFEYAGKYLPCCVDRVLRMMTYSGTARITVEGWQRDLGGSCSIQAILLDIAKEKGFVLESFIEIDSYVANILLCPTKELIMYGEFNEFPASQVKLTSSLKKLCLSGTLLTATDELFEQNLLQLEFLNLNWNRSINWRTSDLDFSSRFPKLKLLDLGNCKIGMSIERFKFPDSVEKLVLESNGIRSIRKVSFPASLKHLNLSFNTIQSLCKVGLPQSLRELTAFHNKVKKVDLVRNKSGKLLKIKMLLLSSGKFLRGLPNFSYSTNLIYLSLKGYKVDKLQILDTLVRLRLDNCHFGTQTQVLNFGPHSTLRYLHILYCRVFDTMILFPQSLEEVDIENCRCEGIPSLLANLQNLKVLRVRHNSMIFAACDFSTTSIEVLDLSNNQIVEVSLLFPHNSITNLKVVRLDYNMLAKFDLAAIGHGRFGVQHKYLREIWLIGIKCMNEHRKRPFIASLPSSVEYLCLKESSPGQGLWSSLFLTHINELNGALILSG